MGTVGIRAILTTRIEDFRARHGLSGRAFCREADCDAKLFHRLRRGHAYTLDTLEAIERFMDGFDAAHPAAAE